MLVALVSGKNISKSYIGGYIVATLVVLSYVQVNAIAESYYRQFFATVIFTMAINCLDKYLSNCNNRDLMLFALLGAGATAYHISMILLIFITCIFVLSVVLRKRNRKLLGNC
ncbi:MAG: hypothetical protein H5T41_06940 [Methanomassiliicoccales archaeon]|nr:hypothetical protein [Methanomassiliicoccales archaeon]